MAVICSNTIGYCSLLNRVQFRTSDRIDDRIETVYETIREGTLASLETFLGARFDSDDNLLAVIKPFVELNSAADLSEVHALVAPDLDLATLFAQFTEICESPDIASYRKLSLQNLLLLFSKSTEVLNTYKEVIIVLSRIYAATPHAADVERCVSANNLLKTVLRSRLSVHFFY